MVNSNRTETTATTTETTTKTATTRTTDETRPESKHSITLRLSLFLLLLATLFGYRRLLIGCLLLLVYSIGIVILFNLGLSYWLHPQPANDSIDQKKKSLYHRLNFSTPAAYSAALIKNSWETHTEWRQEPLHPSLQPKTTAVLDRLIAKIIRDFVCKWYNQISPPSHTNIEPSSGAQQQEKFESNTPTDTFSSPAFPLAVEKTIRHSLRILFDRFGKIDLANLIIHKILPILTTHVEAFRQAEYDLRGGALPVHDHSRRSRNESRGRLYRAFFSSGNDEIDLLLSRLHADVLRRKSQEAEHNSPSNSGEERLKPSSRLHPAVDVPTPNSQSSEQAHLRKLLELLLPLILPPSESKSVAVKSLVVELLACCVITPVIEMLSDSDFWNNLIEERAGNVIREQRMVEQFRQVLDRQLSFVTTSSSKMEIGGTSSSASPSIKPVTGSAGQTNQSIQPIPTAKQNGIPDYEFTSTESISIRSTAKEFERFSRSIQRCNTLFDVRRLKNDVETQIRKAEAELVGGFDPEQVDKTQQSGNFHESAINPNLPPINSRSDLTKFLERLSAARDILDHRLAELGGLSGPVTNSWPSETAGCAEPNSSNSLRTLEALHKLQPSRSPSQILQEILRDRESPALSYFTEFMDRRQRVKLIQFWLAVEGLKNPLEEEPLSNADSKSVKLPGRSVPAKSYASSTHEVAGGTSQLPERDLDAMKADIQAIVEINFSTVEATDLLGLKQTEVLPLLSFLSPELAQSYQSTFSTRAAIVQSSSTNNKIYFVTEARAALFAMQRKVFDLMLAEDFPAFAAAGDLYLRATASLCRGKSSSGSAASPAGLVTSESFPNLIDLKSSNFKGRHGSSLSHKYFPVTKPQHLSDIDSSRPNLMAGLMGSEYNESVGKKDGPSAMIRSKSFNGSLPSIESHSGPKYNCDSPDSITSPDALTPARKGSTGMHKSNPSTSSIIHTVLRSTASDMNKYNRRIVPSPVPPQVTLQEAFDERLPGERLSGPTHYDQHMLSLSNYTFPVHLPSSQSSSKFQPVHQIQPAKFQMSPSLDFLISPCKGDRAPLFGDDLSFSIRNASSARPLSLLSNLDVQKTTNGDLKSGHLSQSTSRANGAKPRKRDPIMSPDANLALQEALSSIISTSDQSPSLGSVELPHSSSTSLHRGKYRSSCSSLLGDESGSTLDWSLDTRDRRLNGDLAKPLSRSTPSSPVSKPSQRKGLFDDEEDDEDDEDDEEDNLLLFEPNKQAPSKRRKKAGLHREIAASSRPIQGSSTAVTSVAEADERIMKLENELTLLSTLIRRAELTGNKLEIRLVRKSIESVGMELSEVIYRKTRLIQLKELALGGFRAKLVPGRVKLSITGTSLGGHTPQQTSGKDDLQAGLFGVLSPEKKTSTGQQQEYVLYKIEVHKLAEDGSFGSGWIVYRRYSEFNRLNQALKALYPISRQLEFPAKLFGLGLPATTGLGFVSVNVLPSTVANLHNFGSAHTNKSNRNQTLIEQRRLGLERYLKSLIQIPVLCESPELAKFLSRSSSTNNNNGQDRSGLGGTKTGDGGGGAAAGGIGIGMDSMTRLKKQVEFFSNTSSFVRSIYKAIVTGSTTSPPGDSSVDASGSRVFLSDPHQQQDQFVLPISNSSSNVGPQSLPLSPTFSFSSQFLLDCFLKGSHKNALNPVHDDPTADHHRQVRTGHKNSDSIEIKDLRKKKTKKDSPTQHEEHEEEEELEEEGYGFGPTDDRLIDLSQTFKAFDGELITPFTQPISTFLIEIFDLNDHHQWLRKQGIVIILQQILGGTIERKFRESVAELLDDEHLSQLICSLENSLWFPEDDDDQEKAGSLRAGGPKTRSIEEKLMTCEGAYRKLSAIIPVSSADQMLDWLLEGLSLCFKIVD
ncbi:Intermediate filament protein, variant 2 [Puccinia graminis f. sp. tritici]|uniref:Intermediate filament protein, variant 2 n=2 Tax=Puccinia graminis f. sp. tritici TaxID=56615 RepID=A0A5B0SJB9_PUCGR|nr:Intermediate filament protein, variant 2 [Puccinia graminis f. sp. tritici]